MTLAAVVSPYMPINGLTGLGLNGGFLYIGVDGSDPEANPQNCFWDSAGAVGAPQPIDILGGYPMYLGSPARLYTASTYSIRVRDKSGVQVFYEAHAVPAPNVGSGIFNTRAIAAASVIPPAVQSVGLTTLGYSSVGDLGGARYVFAPVQANGPGKFQSLDGAWWSLAEASPTVRMFGAVGDGATDDTVAFQAAASYGGRLNVTAGTYLLGQVNVSVPGSEVVVGPGVTLKLKAGATSAILNITADRVTVSGAGTIDGNRLNQTRAQYVGAIAATNVTDARVDGSQGLTIQNTCGPAVLFLDCNRCSIINTRVSATDLMGLFVNCNGAISDVEVSGCRVDRSMDTTGLTQCGILVQPNGGGAISDFRVRGNRVKMPVTALVPGNLCIGIRATDGVCEGNQTRGGYMGLSIDTAVDVAVSGNCCLAFTTYGIELPATSRCAVTGNSIVGPGYGTGAWGVIMDGGGSSPTQNTISANSITGVDFGAGSSGATATPRNTFTGNNITFNVAGIYLTNGDECVVSSNVLIGQGGGDCVFANNADKLVVADNACRSASNVANFYDVAATQQTFTQINGNMFQGVANLFGFTGGRTAGANCSARGNTTSRDYIDIQANVIDLTSGINPSGSLNAGIGSRVWNTFGGALTTLYVNTSGGPGGWVGK